MGNSLIGFKADERRRRGFPGDEAVIGLRDRVRARFPMLESEQESFPCAFSSSEIGGGEDSCRFADAERVTGVRYPSFESGRSEGVGEGEVTRGVAGISV